MQKTILFPGLFFLVSAFSGISAQSIDNKSWKTYISDPINDTVTFHIHSDSSFVANRQGEVVVRNHCKVSGDTLTILDYGNEEMGCPDMKGVYKINLSGNSFTLILIDDPCDGRSQALKDKKWMQTSK